MQKFLLYGANGYTAQIMLSLCDKYKVTPILAGRNAKKIVPLAHEHEFEYRIFDLNDATATDAALEGVGAVLHCAGPFAHTARQMMEACLRKGVHYLDITGEISVFELAHSLSEQAKSRGIVLLPGSGFDVVPTDCLALELKQALPDATHLELAFAPIKSGISKGTALTMADSMGEGGRIRRNGEIIQVPLGHRCQDIDFGEVIRFCMAIPWGDVATAYYTTGIPNIEVFTTSSPRAHRKLRWQWAYNWLLRISFVRKMVRKKILKRPAGPSIDRRQNAYNLLWGRATNAQGKSVVMRKQIAEGYTLTAHTALWLTSQVLKGKAKPGFCTPAGSFGHDIVRELGLELLKVR